MTVPFQTIHFITYEYFRKTLNPKGQYDPKTHILAGGLAGGIAAAITTPLDVVKTLLQTKGGSTDTRIRQVNGFVEACSVVWKRYGWMGFAKGMSPRVVSHVPATAICWTTVRLY